MKLKTLIPGIVCGLSLVSQASATERLFTYTYEPETLPKGAVEAEQAVTLRSGRNIAVGQESFRRVEFREEIEYGVTDNYQLALYFNHQYESYKDPATGKTRTDYRQKGVSIENKLMVWNPAEHDVGLSLYLEPTYDGEEFELEQKIILGQRWNDWKWALNLSHATEWENDFKDKVGEFEVTFGATRALDSNWSLGFEIRHHAEIEEYKHWEGYALYIGPVASYRRDNWWATLTVMPQIYGANFNNDPDGVHTLELEGHEKINIRLLVGFSF